MVCVYCVEVFELILVFLIYMIKNYGFDWIVGFILILVMLMILFGVGVCFLFLLGGEVMFFYDWYVDLLFVFL